MEIKSMISEQAIQEWKAKYGEILKYESEDGKVGYFRYCNRNEYGYATALMGTNPFKALESIAKACFLGGDDSLLTIDEYLFGVIDWCSVLIKKKVGSSTKV